MVQGGGSLEMTAWDSSKLSVFEIKVVDTNGQRISSNLFKGIQPCALFAVFFDAQCLELSFEFLY